MNTKQKDILQTQLNAEETHNEESTSIHEPLEYTPFYIRKIENEWTVTLGQYRLIESQKTREKAIEELEKHRWEIITTMCHIIHDRLKTLENKVV